jgi:hypothetical protein
MRAGSGLPLDVTLNAQAVFQLQISAGTLKRTQFTLGN